MTGFVLRHFLCAWRQIGVCIKLPVFVVCIVRCILVDQVILEYSLDD